MEEGEGSSSGDPSETPTSDATNTADSSEPVVPADVDQNVNEVFKFASTLVRCFTFWMRCLCEKALAEAPAEDASKGTGKKGKDKKGDKAEPGDVEQAADVKQFDGFLAGKKPNGKWRHCTDICCLLMIVSGIIFSVCYANKPLLKRPYPPPTGGPVGSLHIFWRCSDQGRCR